MRRFSLREVRQYPLRWGPDAHVHPLLRQRFFFLWDVHAEAIFFVSKWFDRGVCVCVIFLAHKKKFRVTVPFFCGTTQPGRSQIQKKSTNIALLFAQRYTNLVPVQLVFIYSSHSFFDTP